MMQPKHLQLREKLTDVSYLVSTAEKAMAIMSSTLQVRNLPRAACSMERSRIRHVTASHLLTQCRLGRPDNALLHYRKGSCKCMQ